MWNIPKSQSKEIKEQYVTLDPFPDISGKDNGIQILF